MRARLRWSAGGADYIGFGSTITTDSATFPPKPPVERTALAGQRPPRVLSPVVPENTM